ncbi:MAG: cytochrome b/b6 domain-containing protein [Gammaproteobacteria bacterium]|jgi:Ni/Fe-hydrogenase 1 B-type cytochrome subunit|nr:cytochrome b/b6 domain-containing protein [Gammaproteobacteria bacterium]
MQTQINSQTTRTAYQAWDRTTRWFHWINVLCVIGLATIGLAILNEKSFGVSADGKVLLKTLHVYVGYVFAVNLGWRFLWAFIGSTRARWRATLSFGPGYTGTLRQYVRGFFTGKAPGYLGHNPVGRIMVLLLLLLLLTQAVSGLVLAGTDLYKLPFGGLIAEWVTNGDPDRLAILTPGSKDAVDPVAYAEMRSFRKPFITTHKYTFYALMTLIFLHIVGVVVTEVREKNGLVSAMITGEKVFSTPPIDGPDAESSTED